MKKVRLGLVGAGWVSRQHLAVINAIDWIEAAGITSRTKAKAEQLTKEYSIPACYDNIKTLVERAKPDALMLLVSEDQMFRVAQEAMKYRLPLFLEKPAGLLPAENYKLLKTADKYSLKNMVGYNRRYYSIFHKGIKIIKDHGPLLGVSIEGHERMWRVRELAKFSQYVLDNWIFANSTHTIDLLRFFAGEPGKIKHITHRYIEKRGDQIAAIMETESGAIGQYSAHWYSPGGWRVVLYGDGVSVEFKPLEKGFWTDKNFHTREILPDEVDIKFKPGFYGQLKAFGNLVLKGKREWPGQDLEGSYKTMLLAKKLSLGGLTDRTVRI